MPLPQDLTATTEEHITSMVRAQEMEGTHLDLKRDLPGRDNRGTHDIASDASAFANSSGGDIIYGIDEDGEGRAIGIVPLAGNADEETRRISDVLLNNIEPRMPGVGVHPILVNGGYVLVVRVPKSWAGPHRVRTNQHFFIRDGLRKRPLDVPEIRGLFLRTEAQVQRMRDFRTARLGALVSGEAPVRLQAGALLVAHLIPTQAAMSNLAIDPVPYTNQRPLPALGHPVIHNARLNLDGALAVRNQNAQGLSHGYSLFFREGYLEAVQVLVPGQTAINLPSLSYERSLIALVEGFRAELSRLGANDEMTCMLSLTRANEVILGVDRTAVDGEGRFDRPTLALPDVLLSSATPVSTALRPLFDLVWQSAGFERSFNFDEDGNWIDRR